MGIKHSLLLLLLVEHLIIPFEQVHAADFDKILAKRSGEINLTSCTKSPGVFPIVSLINVDKQLVRYAQEAGQDQRTQKELDEMVFKLSEGHKNIGLGYHPASDGYGYYRGSHGGRLFIKRHGNVVFVIGKATKKGRDNENKVMRRLERIYEDLEFKGRVQGY
jgi:hypothetical protein